MHELSVVLEAIKQVEDYARSNGISGSIQVLTLRIGELSSIVPDYVRAVYTAATDGTILENSNLEIEIAPASARCEACGKIFMIVPNKGLCPACGGKDIKLLGGREFFIKEITVSEE